MHRLLKLQKGMGGDFDFLVFWVGIFGVRRIRRKEIFFMRIRISTSRRGKGNDVECKSILVETEERHLKHDLLLTNF